MKPAIVFGCSGKNIFTRSSSRVALFMIWMLVSCVPVKEYRRLQQELEKAESSKRTIKKDIGRVEKEIASLQDSITALHVLAGKLSHQIEKRLAARNITVDLNPEQLGKLYVRNQDLSKEYHESLLKNENFRDTASARNTAWLSKSEKELVYWLNYARLNPEKFCMKYIYPLYLQDKNNVYIATLMDYMLSMKPVPALIPDKQLFESAECHAVSMGKEGKLGHARLKGCKGNFSGECCSYGLSDPLRIVIQLLVDEWVPSLGHRYICLGTYSKLGVSIRPHKSFGTNAVLDFSYSRSWSYYD